MKSSRLTRYWPGCLVLHVNILEGCGSSLIGLVLLQGFYVFIRAIQMLVSKNKGVVVVSYVLVCRSPAVHKLTLVANQ